MEMKQCSKGGHYYDASIHSECPYCNKGDVGVTTPLEGGRAAQPGAAAYSRPSATGDMGRTVAIVREELGIDPVVGWLVCMDGKEKGKDFRIHTDNNYIGRGEKMDVCLTGDDTVSRENHAVVSYDSKDKLFYFSPGDGRSIVRLNGKALFNTAELCAFDMIEIGKTRLIFVPLCGEKFEWA